MSTELQPDPAWFEIDPQFYRHGGNCFSDEELLALSDVAGEHVLVVSASGGEEALSLASLGATVTVVDSAEGSARARTLAESAGVAIAWDERDPGAIRLPPGPFDTVYSPFGSLDSLEFFDDWGREIADSLRDGGRLVIHDAHPAARVPGVYKGIFAIAHSYFGDDEQGNGASWNLGDLISALGVAGLATVHLEEMPDSDRYQTRLDHFHNVRWDVRWRVPGAFVLVALKV
jgi:hypothetical protein